MRLRNILVLAALLAAPFAMAQGRMMGGMMRGGAMGDMMLLNRQDVGKELALTAGQRDKIQAFQEDMRAKMMQRMQEMQGGGGDADAMRKEMENLNAEVKKFIDETLDAKQKGRLKELGIQRAGARAVMQPEVGAALELTDDQKVGLQRINEQERATMEEMRAKMQEGNMDREEMRAVMQENRKKSDDAILALLTEGQRLKLKELGGKPFAFDPNEDRGFGG
jgi:hypothetical protein